MTIDAETGLISWTPAEADGGQSYNVTVQVSDDSTPPLASEFSFGVSVEEVNDAPAYLGPLTFTIDEDELAEFDWQNLFADAEDDLLDLTFSIVDVSHDEILDPATTADKLQLLSVADRFGYSFVTLRAEDSAGLATHVEVLVIVRPVDDLPVALAVAPAALTHSITEAQWRKPYFIDLADLFFDAEWGTALDYVITATNPAMFGNALGQTFLTHGGTLALHASGLAGTTEVTITARDEQTEESVSQTLELTVDALPTIWIDRTYSAYEGGPDGGFLVKRSGGYIDQPLNVTGQLKLWAPGYSGPYNTFNTTFQFAANETEVLVPINVPGNASRDLSIGGYGYQYWADGYRFTLSLDLSSNYIIDAPLLSDVNQVHLHESNSNANQVSVTVDGAAPDNAIVLAPGQSQAITLTRTGNTSGYAPVFVRTYGHFMMGIDATVDGLSVSDQYVSFAPNQTSLTITVAAFDTDPEGYYRSPVAARVEILGVYGFDWDTVIASPAQVDFIVKDDDPIPVDLDLGLSEALEEVPGLILGVNDNFDESEYFDEGHWLEDVETLDWDGTLHEIAVTRVAMDYEQYRGREARTLGGGWGNNEGDTILGVLDIGNTQAWAAPYGVPGTLEWTIPAGVQVYWPEVNSAGTRWVPVPASSTYRSNTSRAILVEGLAPNVGELTVAFTPDEDYSANTDPVSDSVLAEAVTVELLVDSNNDGEINNSDNEWEESIPGHYFAANFDDDNLNDIPDYLETEVEGENDLTEIWLGKATTSGAAAFDLKFNEYSLQISMPQNASSFRLWTTPNKGTEVTWGTQWIIGTDEVPTVLYLEGVGEGAGDALLTLRKPGGAVLSTDKAHLSLQSTVVLFVDFGEDDGDHTASRIPLTREQWEDLSERRANWLANMGEPSVPASAYGYGDLLDYAEDAIDALGNVQQAVANVSSPGTLSPEDYLDEVAEATHQYDVYLRKLELTLIVQKQFLAAQWYISSADEELVALVNSLPITIDEFDVPPTQNQFDSLKDRFKDIGRSLNDIDWNLRFADSAAWNGAITLGGGTILVGAMIATGPIGIGVGAFVFGGFLGHNAAVRLLDNQSAVEVALGPLADATGFNDVVISITGKDAFGRDFSMLTAEERGSRFGAGVASLSLGIYAAKMGGGKTATQNRTTNSPSAWTRALDWTGFTMYPSGGGATMTAAGWQSLAIPGVASGVAVASASLGATNVVVYMTGKPKPGLSALEIAAKAAHGFQNFDCVRCANSIKQALLQNGYHGKLIELKTPSSRGNIWSDKLETNISENGYHCAVEVDGIVFDNNNPNGVPYQQWIDDLHSVLDMAITKTPF